MHRLLTGIAFALLATSTQASVLKAGETVCRNARALEQFQTARQVGNENTVEWLIKGAACFTIPEDTPVHRISEGSNGNHAYRTIERRRNLTVWAHEGSAG